MGVNLVSQILQTVFATVLQRVGILEKRYDAPLGAKFVPEYIVFDWIRKIRIGLPSHIHGDFFHFEGAPP